MKKKSRYTPLIVSIFFSLFVPEISMAQYGLYYQPRLMMGASAAKFRISLDTFENVYESRWGTSYGGFLGLRIFSANYAVVKYGNFRKNGKNGAHYETGLNLADARWDEKWYNIGLRIFPPQVNKLHSYYGFGFSFFDVTEVENLSVFKDGDSAHDGLGSGFYLEIGIDYFPLKRMGTFIEMEVASGGVRGKTGFEAMSIGGFRFAAGIILLPF